MLLTLLRWNNDATKIKIKLPIPRIIGWAKDLLFRSNKVWVIYAEECQNIDC